MVRRSVAVAVGIIVGIVCAQRHPVVLADEPPSSSSRASEANNNEGSSRTETSTEASTLWDPLSYASGALRSILTKLERKRGRKTGVGATAAAMLPGKGGTRAAAGECTNVFREYGGNAATPGATGEGLPSARRQLGRSEKKEGGRGRDGWRVGEALSLPFGGSDTVWTRLKLVFDRKVEEKGRRRRGSARKCHEVEHREGERWQLDERRKKVVDAVQWAWEGYTRHAWGMDELRPLTRKGKRSFGLGLTIIDSMDTLWLAGERAEFARCVQWVSHMDLNIDKNVNVFETTIRVLGGLLAAYHLSGEEVLLDKAEDLGRRLAKAFDSPSGIPYSDVNLESGLAYNPGSSPGSSLSEATTLQLEFRYLSEATHDPYFHDKAQRASNAIEDARLRLRWESKGAGEKQGLAPVFVDPETGLFGESGGVVGAGAALVSVGARGDSYYEYLLKQWLHSGKTDVKYLSSYQEAIRGMEASLLRKSYPSGLWFIGELDGGRFSAKMDHLVCFLPGTLALGHLEGAAGSAGNYHLTLALQLMETCLQIYEKTATGLAPEIVYFNEHRETAEDDGDIVIKRRDSHNILRPETLESLYYLYWITRDETFRDRAWAIFEAFEEHCRVDRGGYAGLEDVTDVRSKRLDKMETFFVSESLKYLLMIFSEENPLPFERYVFNTEAHPFPIKVQQ